MGSGTFTLPRVNCVASCDTVMRPSAPAGKSGLSADARQAGTVTTGRAPVMGGGRLAGLYGPMSAFGLIMSALPPEADIPKPTLDFRF